VFYIAVFRPSTAPHSGHRWTTSLHDFIKNGMKQQRKPPTKNTTQHIHHVLPLMRYSVLVTTCCRQDEHMTCCRYRWNWVTVAIETSGGWTTTGAGKDDWSVNKLQDRRKMKNQTIYTSSVCCLMINNRIWWWLVGKIKRM
jgi:hypothetical protein